MYGHVAQLSFVGHHADFRLTFGWVIQSVCTWTTGSLDLCDSGFGPQFKPQFWGGRCLTCHSCEKSFLILLITETSVFTEQSGAGVAKQEDSFGFHGVFGSRGALISSQSPRGLWKTCVMVTWMDGWMKGLFELLQHPCKWQSYFIQNKHWPWQAEAPNTTDWIHRFFCEMRSSFFHMSVSLIVCLSVSLCLSSLHVFCPATSALLLEALLSMGCFLFLQPSPSVLQWT